VSVRCECKKSLTTRFHAEGPFSFKEKDRMRMG